MKKLTLLFTLTYLLMTTVQAQFMEPNIIRKEVKTYTASLVALWGKNDTASIETFTIAGDHLFGRAIHLYPEPHLQQFSFFFNKDGSLRSMDIHFYELSNTSVPLQTKSGFLPYRISMNAGEEVVNFRLINAKEEQQFVHLSKRMDFFGGWIPIFGQWQWLTDLLMEGRLQDELKFINYVIGIYDLEVKKKDDQTVTFVSSISAPIFLMLDEENRIKKVNAMGSPWNYTIFRSEKPLDVENFTRHFAQKPVIGDPSPDETAVFEVVGTKLSVSYGRPSRRGRKIFGHVVPYGQVWRTGAGPATKLTFDKDLLIGDKHIPKGTYNLYTIPDKDSWQLIFNTQKDAWGSAYRPEFDFTKIAMQVVDLPETVEQFSIQIDESKKGGILKLSWDKTTAYVDFSISNRN